MDFDVPTDLINKAQIGFREAAGLPSFDPENTTLPSIPTVEASISTLDPSPPHLRCKYCHGKLLRGLQSLICIYCGEYQRNDRNPDPISFNSTHGYSWLLQSLNFNGSERVGSFAEGIGINGGQSPAEDELTLSELLDLKLLWRDVPKKLKINLGIKTAEHNSSLNPDTSDFESFFTESKRVILSHVSEEPVVRSVDQNKALEGHANLTPVTSSIDEHDDASFGWNAEFQSAENKMENEKPESVDQFVGPEADLSAEMDAVFGPMEGFSNKKPNADPEAFQDDLFGNVGSASFQQAEQLDSVVQAKDDLSGHLNDLNVKEVDGDWFGDSNWQKSSAEYTVGKPNDSSIDWFENTNWQKSSSDNMGSASFQQAEQLDSVVHSNNDLSGHLNDLSVKDVDGDCFSESDWQKNTAENTVGKPNDSSINWFEDTNWQKSSIDNVGTIKDDNLFKIKPQTDLFESEKSDLDNPDKHHSDSTTDWFQGSTDNTGTIKDDNLFDIKSQIDLIRSEKSELANSDKHHSEPTTDWFQDSQWVIGGSSSNTNIMANNNDDDGFDEWNDFTSSMGNQDSRKESSNGKVGSREKMSDLNLFPSTTDPQEVDFGNFLQSDRFSGDKSSNKTQAVYDIFSEVSTASRNVNANAGAGNIPEGTNNDKNAPNATTSSKNDVEMLLSQMHDLSFMLKSELSIPSKPDDLGPSHS